MHDARDSSTDANWWGAGDDIPGPPGAHLLPAHKTERYVETLCGALHHGAMKEVSNISRRRRSKQLKGGAEYEAKRGELLKIAARLFKDQGFQSTRLMDIAQEAGLDRATVYYYVGSKEELFRENVEGVLDTNIVAAQSLIENEEMRSIDRLKAIYISLMVDYEENYPATFVYIQEQMHQVGSEETAWAQEIIKKTRQFDQILLGFIQGAIDEGDLRSDIPGRLVEHALFGMLNWTHRWFVPGKGMTGQQIAEAFWSIFIDGMRGTTAPATENKPRVASARGRKTAKA